MATRRKFTEQGMGAVDGKPAPVDDDDARPLGVRDTVPAPPMVAQSAPVTIPASAKSSGAPRRLTREAFPSHHDTPPPVSTPVTPTPASAPPEGRYSSAVPEDTVPEPLPERAPPSKGTLRRSLRQPLRVDEVGQTSIIATKDASLTSKPRLVDRKRISESPLSARDAFILSLIDGALTVQDLVDAAGMPEPEVTAILGRLSRLGIVSLGS